MAHLAYDLLHMPLATPELRVDAERDVSHALRRMSRWDQQFTGLGIQHLRSTTSIHPDPSSSYALEVSAALSSASRHTWAAC